jgi:hypothetical protein
MVPEYCTLGTNFHPIYDAELFSRLYHHDMALPYLNLPAGIMRQPWLRGIGKLDSRSFCGKSLFKPWGIKGKWR